MMPLRFLSKLCVYNIKINGVVIKTRVVDHESVLATGIAELKAGLDHLRIVGFDLKRYKFSGVQLLLLYVRDRCLVIQLQRMVSNSTQLTLPGNLASFLSDESVCFVGAKVTSLVSMLKSSCKWFCCDETGNKWLKTTVDIGELAAKALKNKSLENYGSLVELASKIGFEFKGESHQDTECPDWRALCFSEEEVKYAVHDAYVCYNVGHKILGTLWIGSN